MKSEVFFFPCAAEQGEDRRIQGVQEVFSRTGFSDRVGPRDFVAVKLHFGETGNRGYIRAPIVRKVVEQIKETGARPFLTDTNTLYTGERANSVDHLFLLDNPG